MAYYIVTDKSKEIAEQLIARVHRGVSNIQITGMYSHAQHNMLFVVVRRAEAPTLKQIVYEIDKGAFLIGINAREVNGMGFDKYMSKDPKLLFRQNKKIKDDTNNVDTI